MKFNPKIVVMKWAFSLVVAVFFTIVPAAPAAQRQIGSAGWSAQTLGTGEYDVLVDSAVHFSGVFSALVRGVPRSPYGTGALVQRIDAVQWRGRRLKLTAAVRQSRAIGTGAYLSLAATTSAAVPTVATTEERGLAGNGDWATASVEMVVPPTARAVEISLVLNGQGSAWFDDVRLSALSDSAGGPETSIDVTDASFEQSALIPIRAAPLERPRVTTAVGLDNIEVFARLLGLVRHFYPSEAVRTTNWDDFAIRGIREVESAPTEEALGRALQSIFSPVAPTVEISVGSRATMLATASDTGSAAGIMYWRNEGLELPRDRESIYQSSLVTVPASEASASRGSPSVTAWTGKVGRGVWATVPMMRLVELPQDSSSRTRRVDPRVAQITSSPNDRASRLAGVIITWNAIRHGHPYFDVTHANWDAALRPALKKAATDSSPLDYRQTLMWLLARAEDGHGNVLLQAAPYRLGFLPFAVDWIENQLIITTVGADAPSAIQRGARIIAIDGTPIESFLTRHEDSVPGATAEFRRYRARLDVVLGPRDSMLIVSLKSPGSSAIELVRTGFTSRARVTGPAVQSPVRELGDSVVYVDLARITDALLQPLLPRLVAARAIVFDARGYPRVTGAELLSHLSRDTLLSDRFERPLLREPDARSIEWTDHPWVIPPSSMQLKGRVAFLIGPGAISAAESLLGVVEHYHLGELVGSPTAGTNGNVNQFWIPGRFQVVFTGMRVQKRSGAVHHGVGIRPTLAVAPTVEGTLSGRDEVLEAAIRALAQRR